MEKRERTTKLESSLDATDTSYRWLDNDNESEAIALLFIQIHPRNRLRTDASDDIVSSIRISCLRGRSAHCLHQIFVLKPVANFSADLWRVLTIVTKTGFQNDIDVSSFLTRQETCQHTRKTYGCSFSNCSWPSLGHKDICSDHVFGHVGDESQTNNIDISICVWFISCLFGPLHGLFHLPAGLLLSLQEVQKTTLFLSFLSFIILHYPLPITCFQAVF
mmetsp:Transcript_20415/g.50040  ORF Transcript_20415/g.50040 Transcript_20415/m.50040 type:complete len:219 (-) Transcript_20415:1344-2000(-)